MDEPEKQSGADQNPEAAGKQDAAPKRETLEFKNLQDVGSFINYIGDPTLLEFAEAVKDRNDQVLIQKGTALRQKMFESLVSRKAAELPSSFLFNYSKNLKERLKASVARSLFVSLTKEHYHIAPALLKITEMDHAAMYAAVMENRSMLDLFVALDRERSPILPHLGEAALLAGAVAENLCRHLRAAEPRQYYAAVRRAFQGGLLHDISLADDDNFLMDDIERAKESEHEKKSAEMIKRELRDVEPEVAEAVAAHHREDAPYWKTSAPQLDVRHVTREAVSFAEFFYCQYRAIYQFRDTTKETHVGRMFYTLGQAFGMGFFHPAIFQVISRVRESLKKIMNYGMDVGRIERSCVYTDSAIAYPAPRCTQVLCRNRIMECELVQASFPISVVQPTKYFGNRWGTLKAGEYPKCKLTDKLPDPPEEIQKM
ncbi:MAG: HDIG domain-containing protein [Spirochaetes bacterium]|nr:HDIG domain-containing protein [Spirochaetota bacterium]